MGSLNKLLIRDIIKSKAQFFAASSIVFAGIAVFLATYLSYCNLKNSEDNYYSQYKFLDYYAEANKIDKQVVDRIKHLNGVAYATGRITQDVALDMGEDKRIVLRIISVPDHENPEVNRLYGDYFLSNESNVCLLHKKFADYYNINRGDTIKIVINQRYYNFKVDGIVESPEFIYTMQSSTSFSLSAENFGIVYIKDTTAKRIFGIGNTFNQMHVIFSKDLTDKNVIIDEIENILKQCGFIRGTLRKDQISCFMVNNDLRQIRSIAYMFPILFLVTATMMIYAIQKRIINNQRTLIGVMKASGYTDLRILWHYTVYSLLVCVAGIIPGILAGIYMGLGITYIYIGINNIPVIYTEIYWDIILLGVFLSLFFCLLGGYLSAKNILKIPPAQAMRSEAPDIGGEIFIEKISIIWDNISFKLKGNLRNIIRNKQRTILALSGFIFTIMILIVSIFFLDSFNYLLEQHFFHFQSQDYKINFSRPVLFQDVVDLGKTEGVREIQPILEIPIRLKKGWTKKDSIIIGLPPNNNLYRIENLKKQTINIPKDGMLISKVIADEMRVKLGDTVEVEFLTGGDIIRNVRIVGYNRQLAGFGCYMDIVALGDITGEGKFSTSALLQVDNDMDKKVMKEILKSPVIVSLERRLSVHSAFLKYLQVVYSLVGFMIAFGGIMGFAIIFNTTIIVVTERRRELASLKVLGYTRMEIESIIFRENIIIAVLSILPGVLLGIFMANQVAKMFSNEVVLMQVVIYPRTYILAVLSIFIFVTTALLINRKNISGLDMTEVLKNRDG